MKAIIEQSTLSDSEVASRAVVSANAVGSTEIEGLSVSMSLAEKRLLYLATDNGGMEYAAAEEVDEIFCTGPWIEEEIINRASQRSGSASGC